MQSNISEVVGSYQIMPRYKWSTKKKIFKCLRCGQENLLFCPPPRIKNGIALRHVLPFLTSHQSPQCSTQIHFCPQSIDIQSISIQIPSRIVQVLTYLSDTAFHLPRFTTLNWIATICSDNFLCYINVYLYSVFYKACITSQMHLPAC